MMVVTILLGVVAGILLLPTVSDLAGLVRLLARRGAPDRKAARRELPRFLFLVPAHDEELMIESCVRSLVTLRYPPDRCDVVVVADNCSDRTAVLAQAAGARCVERRDPLHPGKPHAIAWALRQLPLEAWDAVVIVDADAIVDAEFAAAMAAAGASRHLAVQPYNGVRNPDANALTRMAAVLAAAKHRFAYPFKTRVGVNVPLSAGMCIGTDLLRPHGWEAWSIGEDWELYAILTARGTPVRSAPAARLYAQEGQSLRHSVAQRQRWTAGKLTVLRRHGPALLRSSAISWWHKLDALAELASLGPVVHLGLVGALAGLTLAVPIEPARALSLALLASLLRHVVYGVAALAVQPRPLRALAGFAFLPCYAVWRLAVEASALRMVGDRPWVRTPRHP